MSASRALQVLHAGFCFSVALCRFFQLARELLNALTHDLASLKFYRRARRDHKTAAGLIGVASNSGLCQARLKNAEVAQFNRNVVRQAVGDFIERALDDVKDLMLNHAGLVADRNDDVALC